ncbi:MAG: hypothetical protein ACLSHJ_11425 [Oscillospiraceae bacterium]
MDKKLKSDGVIELLRKGMRYKHLRLDLFYVRPSVHNPEAAELYEKNIFSVTRLATVFQLQPSFGTGCLYLHQRSASNHHGAEKPAYQAKRFRCS